MIRIAIVGEIGSGKTFVSKAFKLPVFNADKEVSNLYKKDKNLYLKLKRILPKFIKSYPLKKDELLKAIFSNNTNLNKISRIVHPFVRKKMNNFLKKNKNKKFIVFDIPLYFENKIYNKNDIVIYVDAKKSQISKNLKKRKNFNKKIYEKLKNIQLKNEKKKIMSDFIIRNTFNEKSLKKRVNVLKLKIKNYEGNNSRY